MTVRLTVHIGAGKTGTSAIQAFLRLNAAALAKDGVLVPSQTLQPESRIEGHQVWFFDELRRLVPGVARRQLQDSLLRITHEATTPVRQIILSAENLSHPLPWAALFDRLPPPFELHIVFYARRQDEYLLSAWQQWHSKETGDFWAWLVRHVGVQANWRLTLMEWEKAAPRERIDVRVYDRRRLKDGNVIADFRDCIQSDLVLQPLAESVNPSFDAGVLDLMAGNKALFESIHDNGFFRFVEAMTGSAHFSVRGESTITFEQRLAILERYEKSNAWVRETYLNGRGGETLFAAPQRGDYRELSRDEIEKKKWSLVADLLYKMHLKTTAKPRPPTPGAARPAGG